jgi:hypothetical protein
MFSRLKMGTTLLQILLVQEKKNIAQTENAAMVQHYVGMEQ